MRFSLQNRKIRTEQLSSKNDLVLWVVTPCVLVQRSRPWGTFCCLNFQVFLHARILSK